MQEFIKKNIQHPLIPFYCMLLCILSIAIQVPYNGSLWLDELLSAWVSSGSYQQVIQRASYYQGQSPAYFILLNLFRSMAGESLKNSEIIIRSLSLIGGLFTLVVFFSLARRLYSSQTAAAATIFLLACNEFQTAVLSARPYILALLFSLLSLYLLLEWIKNLRPAYIIMAACSFVFSLYLHPVFICFSLVLLVFFLSQPTVLKHYYQILISFLIAVLLLLPLASQILDLSKRSEQLSFAPVPGMSDLFKLYFPPFPSVALITVTIVSAVLFKAFKLDLKAIDKKRLLQILFWLLIGPLVFFLHANLSSYSLFLSRIVFWRLPAFALLAAVIISAFKPLIVRNTSLVILTVLIVSTYSVKKWNLEDWREASHTVSSYLESEANTNESIIFYSGLIESDDLSWISNPKHYQYLISPLSFYGFNKPDIKILPGKIHLQDSKNYLKDTVIPELEDRVLFVTLKMVKSSGDGRYFVHEEVLNFLNQFGFVIDQQLLNGIVQVYSLKKIPDAEAQLIEQ